MADGGLGDRLHEQVVDADLRGLAARRPAACLLAPAGAWHRPRGRGGTAGSAGWRSSAARSRGASAVSSVGGRRRRRAVGAPGRRRARCRAPAPLDVVERDPPARPRAGDRREVDPELGGRPPRDRRDAEPRQAGGRRGAVAGRDRRLAPGSRRRRRRRSRAVRQLISTAPTGTVSPARDLDRLRRRRRTGATTSVTALSVSSSTSGWSRRTSAPTSTSTALTRPSVTSSPSCGSSTGVILTSYCRTVTLDAILSDCNTAKRVCHGNTV